MILNPPIPGRDACSYLLTYLLTLPSLVSVLTAYADEV